MRKNKFYLVAVILMATVFGHTMNAQSNKEEVDFMQSIFGMEKKAIVTEFLAIESSDPFWEVYDAYETERKELGKKRIDALSDYVSKYNELNDDKYDDVVKTMISLRKSTDKLIDTYYKKVKKVSGPKVAAQFFQIEEYFLSAIRLDLMEGIPYIGELNN